MQLRCPYCQGGAFVMVTCSDGATVTVCTRCDQPVPFETPREAPPPEKSYADSGSDQK